MADSIDLIQEDERRKIALTEIEKRLECDGHNHKKYKHRPGRLDDGLRRSLRRFQRKNKVYEYASLRPETVKLLATRPIDNNYMAFKRALAERIVEATGILEDGTVNEGSEGSAPVYTDEKAENIPYEIWSMNSSQRPSNSLS